MKADHSIQGTNKMPTLHILMPILLAVTGFALVAYMIPVEGELGGIPILLILAGVGWYLIARARVQSNRK